MAGSLDPETGRLASAEWIMTVGEEHAADVVTVQLVQAKGLFQVLIKDVYICVKDLIACGI